MAFRNLPEMPCGPILELHGQRKRFHVPYGLKRLLEEMTREVLRYQPDNIFDFLATFMEARLQKKLSEEAKNQKRKSWEQHRWSWQGESVLEPEQLKDFLETLPAPVEEVQHHATVIQAAFRGYQARKKVKEIRKSIEFTEAKRRSEAEAEVKRKSMAGGDEKDAKRESKDRRKTLEDLTPDTATDAEVHAAVIIQAGFRGFHARNVMKKKRQSQIAEYEEEESLQASMKESAVAQAGDTAPLENSEQIESAPETDQATEPADEGEMPAPNQEEPASDAPDAQADTNVANAEDPAAGGNPMEASEGEEEEESTAG